MAVVTYKEEKTVKKGAGGPDVRQQKQRPLIFSTISEPGIDEGWRKKKPSTM